MNANQKLRLPRTVAIVAIAFAGGAGGQAPPKRNCRQVTN